MNDWLVRHGGGVPIGPIATDVLYRGISDGKVPLDAEVRPARGGAWLPIEAYDEFVDAVESDDAATRVVDTPWLMDQMASRPGTSARGVYDDNDDDDDDAATRVADVARYSPRPAEPRPAAGLPPRPISALPPPPMPPASGARASPAPRLPRLASLGLALPARPLVTPKPSLPPLPAPVPSSHPVPRAPTRPASESEPRAYRPPNSAVVSAPPRPPPRAFPLVRPHEAPVVVRQDPEPSPPPVYPPVSQRPGPAVVDPTLRALLILIVVLAIALSVVLIMLALR